MSACAGVFSLYEKWRSACILNSTEGSHFQAVPGDVPDEVVPGNDPDNVPVRASRLESTASKRSPATSLGEVGLPDGPVGIDWRAFKRTLQRLEPLSSGAVQPCISRAMVQPWSTCFHRDNIVMMPRYNQDKMKVLHLSTNTSKPTYSAEVFASCKFC